MSEESLWAAEEKKNPLTEEELWAQDERGSIEKGVDARHGKGSTLTHRAQTLLQHIMCLALPH